MKILAVILIFLTASNGNLPLAHAVTTCHQCEGINCLRTNYTQLQTCVDPLDVCISVFDGANVLESGCLQQISSDLRKQCYNVDIEDANTPNCYKCNKDDCNNVAAIGFECIQCDSNVDKNCREKPETLTATKCPAPTSINSYCYVHETDTQTVRGCSVGLKHQKECLSRTDCYLCSPNEIEGCNRVQLSRNATNPGDDQGGSSGDGSGGGDGSSGGGSSEGGSSGGGSSGSGSTGEGSSGGGSSGGGSSEGGSSEGGSSGGDQGGSSGNGTDQGGGSGSGSNPGSGATQIFCISLFSVLLSSAFLLLISTRD